MKPRIAIPVPTSTDLAYNQRSWPQYADAIERSGGEPVESPHRNPAAIPTSSTAARPSCSPAAQPTSTRRSTARTPSPSALPPTPRENVDELLLQDAHNLYKPILAICFGVQILNVWRGGTLVQDLAPMPVNHPAGRTVAIAHTAAIAPESLLGTLLAPEEAPEQDSFLRLPINSSHHQAIGIPGDGLRISARCPQDAVIEAVEGGQAPKAPPPTSSSASNGTPSAATTSAPPPEPSSTASSPKPPPGPHAPSTPPSRLLNGGCLCAAPQRRNPEKHSASPPANEALPVPLGRTEHAEDHVTVSRRRRDEKERTPKPSEAASHPASFQLKTHPAPIHSGR